MRFAAWLVSSWLALAAPLVSVPVFAGSPCENLLAGVERSDERLRERSDDSLLVRDYLKPPSAGRVLTDRFHENEGLPGLPAFRRDMPALVRLEALRGFPIRELTAAPGHLYPRNPSQIASLAKHVAESGGGNFSHDRILINVVTGPGGVVRAIDLWNGHHRVLAYLEVGLTTVGQMGRGNIEIVVDGVTADGWTWDHYLPIAGLSLEAPPPFEIVPEGGDVRHGTVRVSGALSNFELGSRTSVGQLLRNARTEQPPRIGVYTGTFDPVHEAHTAVARRALELFGLDEVVFIPNVRNPSKPKMIDISHRRVMLGRRVGGEAKLNLFTADSSRIIDRFGRIPLFERIAQAHGTSRVFQIMGEDSFLKHLERGEIDPAGGMSYIVFRRPDGKGTPPVEVPENLRGIVTLVSDEGIPEGISSTRIRERLARGEMPGPEELHPDVLEYIRGAGLYRK